MSPRRRVARIGLLVVAGAASACSTDFADLFAGCPSGDCVGAQGGAGATGGGSGAGAGSGGSGGALPPSGTVMWSARIGDAGTQRARSIVGDAEGNAVLAGYFFDGIVLDGQNIVGAGEHDVFLQKRDVSGIPLWSKHFGGAGNDTCRDVAVAPRGEIVLTGHFSATIDFGGDVLTSEGLQDMFLAKFAADGTHLWSKSFGDPTDPQFGQSVAVGADGSIYLAAQFSGEVDFGNGPLTSAGGSDVLVARFDAGGTTQWSRAFGGTGYDLGRSIAVDAAGDVYVAGVYEGSVAFGGSALEGDANGNLFVAKYDASGAHVWSHGWGVGADITEAAMEIHPEGGVVVSGDFAGSLEVGTEPLLSKGVEHDVFVLRLDGDGEVLHARRFGDVQREYAEGLDVSAGGHAFVGGTFAGVLDFAGAPLSNVDAVDVFVTRLDGALEHVWSSAYGGVNEQHTHTVGIDPQGYVLAAGCLYGNPSSIEFDDVEHQSAGEFDIWMVKLAP
jgi:hypothetical protein